LRNFKDLGLAEPILRAVSTQGYKTPTPIQEKVIPAMLKGRDIVGIAQTGTGKTGAFVLPLLHGLNTNRVRPPKKGCRALILAPTRELANQTTESIRTYGQFINHSVALIVGGVRPGPQIKKMARGVDIAIATPGRLLDHISNGAVRLDNTAVIVLDEGDQMLDLGFMPDIRKIMKKLPHLRQTMMFSATMPKQIRALANDFLKKPIEISVAPSARPIELIDQKVIFINHSAKRAKLITLLSSNDVERAIVFVRTKRGADRVHILLEKAGLSAMAIHGNKTQNQREKALSSFKSGQAKILVATDIAARGIDVDDVSHVINFELPNVPEAYVHRIGRTARAGKTGIALSMCDPTEKGLLRDIEKLTRVPLTIDTDNSDSNIEVRQNNKPGISRNRKHSRGSRPSGQKRRRRVRKNSKRHNRQQQEGNDNRPARVKAA
tara:strand:+ start:387 stop:1694 length:1308 start_codon:yes stop_codon:yes gene_type:complete